MKSKWFFSLINIAAICLIAMSIFVLLTVVLTPAGQVPQVMGFSVLRVLTGSMKPEIPADSMLLIQKADAASLQVGDVISFFSPDPSLNGALNTHRIVGIAEVDGSLQFTTKGDANLIEDQYPVDESRVVGKVLFVSTRLGKLLRLVLILVGNLVSALKSAARLAKEEEEAAVRQALEELKAKQNAEEK